MTRHRRCLDCGELFLADHSHFVRCWNCWRRRRDEAAGREAYAAGWVAGFEAAGRVRTAPELDEALLRDCVVLAHPDRHPPGRAAQANRATAFLLGLLEGARGRAAA